MVANAMAYVLFDVLRGPGGKPSFRATFYRSRSRRLHKAVGDGGTLWVVTGIPSPEGKRNYVLAYKLVNCELIPPEMADTVLQLTDPKGRYAIRARDANRTYHFSLKKGRRADLDPYLEKLTFVSGGPISAPSRTAFRLRSFPVLTDESVALLERLERKSRYGRNLVISYAREDEQIAVQLQAGMEQQGVTTFRDLTSFRLGKNWEDEIKQSLDTADAMLVLISPDSNNNQNVQSEVRWALERLGQPASIKCIIPILIPGISFEDVNWEVFKTGKAPQFQNLTGRMLPANPDEAFFARLAQLIGEATEDR